jgi:hypothetical protein
MDMIQYNGISNRECPSLFVIATHSPKPGAYHHCALKLEHAKTTASQDTIPADQSIGGEGKEPPHRSNYAQWNM